MTNTTWRQDVLSWTAFAGSREILDEMFLRNQADISEMFSSVDATLRRLSVRSPEMRVCALHLLWCYWSMWSLDTWIPRFLEVAKGDCSPLVRGAAFSALVSIADLPNAPPSLAPFRSSTIRIAMKEFGHPEQRIAHPRIWVTLRESGTNSSANGVPAEDSSEGRDGDL